MVNSHVFYSVLDLLLLMNVSKSIFQSSLRVNWDEELFFKFRMSNWQIVSELICKFGKNGNWGTVGACGARTAASQSCESNDCSDCLLNTNCCKYFNWLDWLLTLGWSIKLNQFTLTKKLSVGIILEHRAWNSSLASWTLLDCCFFIILIAESIYSYLAVSHYLRNCHQKPIALF